MNLLFAHEGAFLNRFAAEAVLGPTMFRNLASSHDRLQFILLTINKITMGNVNIKI